MKTNIQRFQIIFLTVLYGIAFIFFHVFPQPLDAANAGTIKHAKQSTKDSKAPASSLAENIKD